MRNEKPLEKCSLELDTWADRVDGPCRRFHRQARRYTIHVITPCLRLLHDYSIPCALRQQLYSDPSLLYESVVEDMLFIKKADPHEEGLQATAGSIFNILSG
jgi:hypothetical protein